MKQCKDCGTTENLKQRKYNGVLRVQNICKACYGIKITNIHKGKILSEETKRKIGKKNKINNLGRIPWNKGKTLKPLSKETKLKLSNSNIGHKVSPETRIKIGKSNSIALKGRKIPLEVTQKRLESRKGYRHSEETKRKIGLGNKGKEVSLESRKKLRDKNLNKKLSTDTINKMVESRKGYRHSEETKRKIGLGNKGNLKLIKSSLDYFIKNRQINGKVIWPCIGRNEKIALDIVEKKLNIKIERQHPVLQYYVDGYDKKNNTVYEVYENFHKNRVEKDNKRMNEIIKELNCAFVIINDNRGVC